MAQKRATWPLRIFVRTLEVRTCVSWWSSMRGSGIGGSGVVEGVVLGSGAVRGWDEVPRTLAVRVHESQQQHARSKCPRRTKSVQLYILSIKNAPFRNTKMDDMMLARQLAEKYW
jgi:hypothetical protein